MTDYEALQAEADGCHAWVLSRLADCCEESGDAERTLGYHWLASHGKWPNSRAPFAHHWCDGGVLGVEWHSPYGLPRRCYERIAAEGKLTIGNNPGGFRTVSAALDAAALAVGRWILAPSATVAASAGGAP